MKNAPHRPPTGPVTIMHGGKLQLGTWKAGTVRRSDGTLIAANVERSTEGIRWIRGWYDAGVPEGKALIAAAALAPSTPRDLCVCGHDHFGSHESVGSSCVVDGCPCEGFQARL